MGAENLAPTRIRSPDRPARSESLYRLSYPGPPCKVKTRKDFLKVIKCLKLVICNYYVFQVGPEQLSRYSDSLRAGRYGNRIPMGGGEGEIFHTRPQRPWSLLRLLSNRYRVSFQGVKRPGRGVDHPPPSSVEVKE